MSKWVGDDLENRTFRDMITNDLKINFFSNVQFGINIIFNTSR